MLEAPIDWVRRRPRVMGRVLPYLDGLAYALPAYQDLKSSLNDLSRELIDFRLTPESSADESLAEFVSYLVPNESSCPLIRVGGTNDGGYVMLDFFGFDHAISIGIGNDVSWDLDLSERGVPISMFDPTVKRPPHRVPGAKFHRRGLGPQNTTWFSNLAEIVRLSIPESSSRLLLKCDVEGAEWESLRDADFTQFSEVVIEFHDLANFRDPLRSEQMLTVVRSLAETHFSVHIHANNYSKLFRLDRYWFCDVVEVTWARRDTFDVVGVRSQVTHPSDAPCNPRASEICLEGILRLA